MSTLAHLTLTREALAGEVASCAAADAPPLAPGRVDVWRVALDRVPAPRVLTPEERAHAERMRVDGARWAAARAALRTLLGVAMGMSPDAVPIERDVHGRPVLAHAGAPHVSLAHAGGFALVALRPDADVGVDIEVVREDVDIDAVAADFLPAAARGRLAAADPATRRARFFAEWTHAEALAKARGLGLPALPEVEDREFRGVTLPAPAGHAAAVASRGAIWSVTCRRLDGDDPAFA